MVLANPKYESRILAACEHTTRNLRTHHSPTDMTSIHALPHPHGKHPLTHNMTSTYSPTT